MLQYFQFTAIGDIQIDPKCVFGLQWKIKIISLFNLFLLLFMSLITLFGTIHRLYCTISTNFYLCTFNNNFSVLKKKVISKHTCTTLAISKSIWASGFNPIIWPISYPSLGLKPPLSPLNKWSSLIHTMLHLLDHIQWSTSRTRKWLFGHITYRLLGSA